jgi:hypothetical protein
MKKKILITGCNKLQCSRHGWKNQQLAVVPAHDSLYDCLVDMGYEVDQRVVSIGEDLKEYEKVIVFIASPRQLLAQAFYQGLWAIHVRPDTILGGDDWQIGELFKGVASCTDEDSMFKEFSIKQHTWIDKEISKEKLLPFKDAFFDGVAKIASGKMKILLPAFAGGDLQKIIKYDPSLLFSWNPNPYHRNRVPGDRWDTPRAEMALMESSALPEAADDTTPPEKKSKVCNFASLVQGKTIKWLKNQKITEWPIEYFGKKEEGQRRLAEDEMVKVYDQQWCCLMPGYAHTSGNSASGWWRARPLQVADAGSIIIGEFAEMMVLYGDARLAKLKVKDLEKMTVDQLKNVAAAQRKLLYARHPLDRNVTRSEITRALQ